MDDRRIDVLRATRRGGRLRVAGRLLRAVSVVLMFGGFLVGFWIYFVNRDSIGLIAGLAWLILGMVAVAGLCAVYLLGFLLDRRGARYQALSAADAMSQDWRPPVLYFRSFLDEPETRRIRTTVSSSVNYSYGESEEEYLRAEILKAGPFVAVGRPGDALPQLGANRLYVDDADWQAAVLRLMDGAAGAVIRIGPGGGLSWEIQQAVRRFPPERLAFVVPRDPQQYSCFKAQIDPYLPRPLPWYPDVEARNWFERGRQVRFQLLGFLCFASDWSAYFELFSFQPGTADIPSKKMQAEFTRCLGRFISEMSQTHGPADGGRE